MKVVVAGADGYIGSRVVRRLSALLDTSVLPLSRRPGAGSPVDLVRDPQAVSKILADFRPEVVINCAGTTSADLSMCVNSHVIATTHLLAAMGEAVRGARLIQLGSAAEYGQAVPEPQLINEDTPPLPQGAYGVSKLAATLLAVTHGPVLGVECIALRVFNLLGPDMPQGTIIPKVLSFLSSPDRRPEQPIELGPLDVYRDFVHVDDVVSAVVAALHAPLSSGSAVVNIASGEPVMVHSLVRRLLDAAGHRGEIRQMAGGSKRSASVTWQRADISRARRLLGWAPQKDLAESILELVKREHPRAI